MKIKRYFNFCIFGLLIVSSISDISYCVSRKSRSAVTGFSWASHIVISGFSTSSEKSTKDEYIELYNPTSNIADISEWRIQTKGTDENKKWVTKVVIPVGTKIQPYNFYLIGNEEGYEGKTPDLAKKFQFGLMSEEGSIRLLDYDGREMDKIGFGSNSVDYEGSPAENDGASLIRQNFGIDTGNNKSDFASTKERDPHNSYSLPEIPGSTVFPAASQPSASPTKTAESLAPGPDFEVSKMYREAKSDWRADKMFRCIGKLERILEIDPNNEAAKKDLKEIPQKIKEDLEKMALVGRDQYYGEAVVAYLDGDYNGAARNLQKILLLTPDDYEVKEWFGRINSLISSKSQQQSQSAQTEEDAMKPIPPATEKVRAKKVTGEETKRKSSSVSKGDIEKADQFYAIGLKEYAAGYVSKAIDAWETCLKFNPNHEKASAALAKARKSSK